LRRSPPLAALAALEVPEPATPALAGLALAALALTRRRLRPAGSGIAAIAGGVPMLVPGPHE